MLWMIHGFDSEPIFWNQSSTFHHQKCREKSSQSSINDHFAWKAVLKDSYASCCIHLLTKELSLITSGPHLELSFDIRPGICWCLVAIPWHLRDYGFYLYQNVAPDYRKDILVLVRQKQTTSTEFNMKRDPQKVQLYRQLILDTWKWFSKKNGSRNVSCTARSNVSWRSSQRGSCDGNPKHWLKSVYWQGTRWRQNIIYWIFEQSWVTIPFPPKEKRSIFKGLKGGTGVEKQQPILGQPAPSPQVRPQSIRSRRVAVHPTAFRGSPRCFSRRDASGVGPSSGGSARNQRAMMVL